MVTEQTRQARVLDNITILPFKFKHLPLLHSLLESNQYEGICHIDMKSLPKVGYIVLLGKVPIAAGFLRRLEPCFAQIDTLASNAYMGSIIRHQGITMVVDELIAHARVLKLKGIVSHTSNAGVLKRAEALGFHVVKETIIALPLK